MRKSAGDKAEELAIKRWGGTPTSGNSGAGVNKGDFTYQDFRVENKSTVKESLSIKKDWLLKISAEARERGQLPALAFQFTNDDGASRSKMDNWVAVPEHILIGLLMEREDA